MILEFFGIHRVYSLITLPEILPAFSAHTKSIILKKRRPLISFESEPGGPKRRKGYPRPDWRGER